MQSELLRRKVVLAMVKLVPLLTAAVNSSRFIPTGGKDTLISDYKTVVRRLLDAQNREQGGLPFTPTQKDNAEKIVHPYGGSSSGYKGEEG
jgi:hypothetical protein